MNVNPIPLAAPKFLQALKDLGDTDEEAVSDAHLMTEYGRLQQQVKSCDYHVIILNVSL